MEFGLRAPTGCSVGPWGLLCGVWAWGSALVDHKWWSAIRLCLDGALGWRDVCPHSVGPRGHLQIGLCGPPFLPDCYLVLRNITSTHWKQTPFF